MISLTHRHPAMPFGNRKIWEDPSSSVLSQYKKYHSSKNRKFNYLGFFSGLKFCVLMEKILPIFLKLNFTLNTLGCYGLSMLNDFIQYA